MRRLFPCIFWICLAGNLLHGLQAQTRDTLRLTLEINTPNLASALEAIETQSPLRFFYKSAWLPNDSISLSLEKNSIAASFDRLLAGTGLVAILLQDRTFAIVPRERWLDLGGPIVSLEPTPSSNLSVSGSQERDSVGNPNKLPSGQEALLTGIIRDGNTQEIISGATIKVPILSKGALTDESGSFQLALPLGEFQASVEAAGYDPLVRTVVILGDGTWDVDMDLKAYSLDAVELEGEATDRNVSSTLIGVNELKIGQIQGIPAFMGEVDVVKSLLTLPGVNTVGEGASGFNVRGGNVDQNLILLDGTPVLNSSHVLGFFSLFHPDIVNKITLYKGHIPAQYGGRLASVLDVGMRRGNFRKFHMKGGVGLVSTRLLMEGPLVHEKVSFLVGMRTSYSNWALRLVSDPLIKSSSARFSDLNGKLSFKINPKQRLDLSAYRSRDLFQYADQFGYSWGTGLVQGQYQYIFNPRTALTVRLQNGRYTADFFDPAGRDAFRLHTGISYTRGTARLRHTPSRVHDIQAGIEWINHRTLPEQIAPGSFNSLIPNNQIPKDRGHEFGLFLQDEWTLTPFISLSAGLRASGFVQTGARTIYEYAENQSRSLSNIVDSTTYGPLQPIQQYGGLEPRVALRVNLDESSSVKVSYNRIQQYIHLVSNTTASTPVDIWQLSNRYVPPQRAHSYSAGYFRNFANNMYETSIEVYYKHIDNLVSYKDLPRLLQNPYLETELLAARGRAYGAEISLRKNRGAITGWLSYAYGRTLRRVAGNFPEEIINGGDWFPAPFDQPHQVNLVSNIKINRRNTLSVNFIYSTGRPITVPVGDFIAGSAVVPIYSDRNQFRIPDYHRLDLSYTVKTFAIRKQRYQDSFTFSLYNLYFRRNAFSVFFEPDDRQIPRTFLLAVIGTAIPALTYNFNF